MSGPLFLAGIFYGACITLFFWFALQFVGTNQVSSRPGRQVFWLIVGVLFCVAVGFIVAYAANILVFAKLLHLPEVPYPAAGAALAFTLLGVPTWLTGDITMRLIAHKSQNFQALAALAALLGGGCIGIGLRYLIFIRLLGFTEEQSPMVFDIGYLIGALYHVLLISAIYKLGQRTSQA